MSISDVYMKQIKNELKINPARPSQQFVLCIPINLSSNLLHSDTQNSFEASRFAQQPRSPLRL